MTLTNDDLKDIKEMMQTTLDEDDTLVRKIDLKHLPTKDEFFTKMDEVMGELKDMREETTLLSDLNRKVNNNEEEIDKIKTHLNLQPAV